MTSRQTTALDPATLERVRRRDPEAMERFFEAFLDRVYGYAVTLVKNPALAEDIVQDAFIRMHRALDRLDPGRDPAPWVYTIVTNAVRDHWRSWEHRHRGQIADVDALWDLPAPEEDPGARLDREAAYSTLHEALGRLSPADREVILLRTFEGLETEDVAKQLGLSQEAVRQRHSRAVRRLTEIYRAAPGEDPVRS